MLLIWGNNLWQLHQLMNDINERSLFLLCSFCGVLEKLRIVNANLKVFKCDRLYRQLTQKFNIPERTTDGKVDCRILYFHFLRLHHAIRLC